MGDELDAYGLLEQAYDDTVMENIEDISPPNSPDSENNGPEVDNSNTSLPQRTFIAHKEMKNIDMECNDEHQEEDEEQEKLQFDFDVPSPAFEAISDEDGSDLETKTTENSEFTQKQSHYETPLNSTAQLISPDKKGENLEFRTEGDTVVDNQFLQDISSIKETDTSLGSIDSSAKPEEISNSKINENISDFKYETEMPSRVCEQETVTPLPDNSFALTTGVVHTDTGANNDLDFNSSNFMFKETREESPDPGEEHLPQDIEAPIPSPFSDIGELSGPETAIISDILKERSDESTDFSTVHSGPTEQESHLEEQSSLLLSEGITETKEKASEDPSAGVLEPPTFFEEENIDKENVQDVGGLFADIFGESDEEEEEFEGFQEEELFPGKPKADKPKLKSILSEEEEEDDDEPLAVGRKDDVGNLVPEESSDEEIDDLKAQKEEMISDFDLMMQRKKEMNKSKRRGRRDFDIINDNDDIIAAMIKQMKDAAEEDRLLNQAGQAATKKLKMLPSVIAHLRKADLQHTFIDCGILPVIKEWLSPLPDNSLPHIQIRSSLLKALLEFPPLDKGALKLSGVGRSVMLLFKHPKECRPNRKMAGKIIAEWARPIFGVTTKFSEMTREDREERDKSNVPASKKRRLSSVEGESGTSRPIDQALNEDKKARRPGDKGFVGRARVPMPSSRDYVVRPKSNVEVFDMGRTQKKALTRFDQQYRKYKDRMGALGQQKGDRAVGISLNGSKMSL